jgi:hypothetical protein
MGAVFSKRVVSCVIWMLYVFILAASLDTLPDPPAVNTQRVEVKAECDLANAPELSLKSISNFSCIAIVVHWIGTHQIFEAQQSSDRIALTQHAGDPSPPALS